ncbi:MAG: TRC40/GET3/ArsA family transport-energizing ATPase, partial [Selenomonadaceae bacterium]
TLADEGKRVLLVSTDPASNLQDVFRTALSSHPTPIVGAPGLEAVNIDPMAAAAAYRERTVAPYRGLLPDAAIHDMEENLSGSCTVEIAAFDEFTSFLTDETRAAAYDIIVFDTAPTGHTLRLLQLPSAWEGFLETNKSGATCLGLLSGLGEKKATYQTAVEHLQSAETAMMLVARPDDTPLKEAARASKELAALGIRQQHLILNAMLTKSYVTDSVTRHIYDKQQTALLAAPETLSSLPTTIVPLRGYNVTGLSAMRSLLTSSTSPQPSADDRFSSTSQIDAAETDGFAAAHQAPSSEDNGNSAETSLHAQAINLPNGGANLPHSNLSLRDLATSLQSSGKRIIFTMGKGGVGKTTVAAAIAEAIAETGSHVLLATTDPAAHLRYVISESDRITIRSIDPAAELNRYRAEVIEKAKDAGASQADIDYVEEDLRSPCTQEIAVFRAFANFVAESDDAVVVIDTAPTGHALLLLDSAQTYHREVERSERGDIPEPVRALLPRLRSDETAVLILTLAEMTPVAEAERLEQDLARADVTVAAWIVNRTFSRTAATSPLLAAKAESEAHWLSIISEHHQNLPMVVLPWLSERVAGDVLTTLLDS